MSQTGHAISQFFLDHHNVAKKWNNNYLISLSVSSQEKLQKILLKLHQFGVTLSYFTEPDIGNELTSICFLETEETNRITKGLQLSFNKMEVSHG